MSRSRSRKFTTYGPLFQVFLERPGRLSGCPIGAVSRPFHEGGAEGREVVGETLQEGREGLLERAGQPLGLGERTRVAMALSDGLHDLGIHTGVEAEELLVDNTQLFGEIGEREAVFEGLHEGRVVVLRRPGGEAEAELYEQTTESAGGSAEIRPHRRRRLVLGRVLAGPAASDPAAHPQRRPKSGDQREGMERSGGAFVVHRGLVPGCWLGRGREGPERGA